VKILARIGLWFGCLLIAVALFSLLFLRFNSSPDRDVIWEGYIWVYRVTMMFALPVWSLYLPLTVKLKDAEDNRIWILLVSGTLIGPLSLTIWFLILQLRGGDAHTIWGQGDPEAPSTAAFMIYASVVGFLAAAIYGIFLKVIYRLTTDSPER
jgi:hypothetical protein